MCTAMVGNMRAALQAGKDRPAPVASVAAPAAKPSVSGQTGAVRPLRSTVQPDRNPLGMAAPQTTAGLKTKLGA